MRAAAFTETGAVDVLRYLELPDPVCAPHEVIVRTFAIGLNFADIYRRRGEYAVTPPSPYILGFEAAGVIEALGNRVSGFRVGERVAFVDVPRANAELVVCSEDKLISLPDHISFAQAAGILLQGLTADYLTRDSHPVRAGETVLVHAGGSGVGSLVLQYCKEKGARTIAVVSTAEKAESARESGADQVVLSAEAVTNSVGREIDVVYDSVGSTLLDSLGLVKDRGHVVFYGWSGGRAPSVDPRILMDRSLRLSGGDLWSFVTTPEERRLRSRKVLADLNAGILRLRVDRAFPLSDAAEAHRHLESRRARGKILLLPGPK